MSMTLSIGFPTLVEVLRWASHLEFVYIDDEQKIKFSMINIDCQSSGSTGVQPTVLS